MIPRPPNRQTLQRGVIVLPSAFTLGNLFFGIYAIVAATRGDLIWAGWFIVFAAILDMLDGSVARFTRTGSRFGAELDSLVDAISFGVAPGFIMYRLYFADTQWSWVISFVYITAVVVRLARFNVEQEGEARRIFHGLPSPAAGVTVASFYPFSRTPWFETHLAHLPWQQIVALGMVLIGVLMVSHVPYSKFPKIGLKSVVGVARTLLVVTALIAAVTVPRYYFFTAGMVYIVWGLARSVALGLLERLPGGDPLLDEEEDEGEESTRGRSMDYADLGPARRRSASQQNESKTTMEDEP